MLDNADKSLKSYQCKPYLNAILKTFTKELNEFLKAMMRVYLADQTVISSREYIVRSRELNTILLISKLSK